MSSGLKKFPAQTKIKIPAIAQQRVGIIVQKGTALTEGYHLTDLFNNFYFDKP